MMKIEMIGYNDTKAIAIYNAIRLMNIVIISFIIAYFLLYQHSYFIFTSCCIYLSFQSL